MPHYPRYTRFAFTINNYKDVDIYQLRNLDYIRWWGRRLRRVVSHIYRDVATTVRNTLKAMKKRIRDRAHIEMARGTGKQNIEYCKKEGDWFEVGKTIEEKIKES